MKNTTIPLSLFICLIALGQTSLAADTQPLDPVVENSTKLAYQEEHFFKPTPEVIQDINERLLPMIIAEKLLSSDIVMA